MQLATKKTLLLSTLLFVVAGLVVLAPPVKAAAPLPEDLIDHFKVYRFEPPAYSGVLVTLTDQWGVEDHIVESMEKFSLNTSKNDSPILDPTAHLSWWSISGDGTDPVRPIVVSHQFGTYDLMVRQPRYLLAPAIKNPEPSAPGSMVGPDESILFVALDHYKCYDAVGPPLGVPLNLQTQFTFETVIVEDPVYFCNPVEKQLQDGTVFPIAEKTAHLTCYKIGPVQPVGISFAFEDQFTLWQGVIHENELLCIPSLKENVVPNEDKTWGKLKSIYR